MPGSAWRELDTGLPAPSFPDPTLCMLVSDDALTNVVVRPALYPGSSSCVP